MLASSGAPSQSQRNTATTAPTPTERISTVAPPSKPAKRPAAIRARTALERAMRDSTTAASCASVKTHSDITVDVARKTNAGVDGNADRGQRREMTR